MAVWIVKPTQVEKVRSEFAHPCLQGQTENPKEGCGWEGDGGVLPSLAWRRVLTCLAPLP